MSCEVSAVVLQMFRSGDGSGDFVKRCGMEKQALTVTCVHWLLTRQQSRFKVNPFYARCCSTLYANSTLYARRMHAVHAV